ncbi:MAG: glycosyltransferase [Cyanobacteria bacterium P01_H01_bin.15]
MKIAIIASGFLPVIDGVTVSGYERLRCLSASGHEVLFFGPDNSSLAHLYPNWADYVGEILPGVESIAVPSQPFFVDFETNVKPAGWPLVQGKLNEFQPEVIHVDEPERLFIGFLRRPGLKYARQHKIPCIAFFRTNFLDYLDDFFPLPSFAIAGLRWALRQLICWVYNSYDVTLVSNRVTLGNVQVLGIKNAQYGNYLGFDADKFGPQLREVDYWARTYQLPEFDQRVKIVFLGRLTPDKGWIFTLNALAKLAPEVLEKVAIAVAGDGPMREKITDTLQQITPHVKVLGRVVPNDVPKLLANCDLHVTTSEKETRGATVVEACACGIPVLGPSAGGVQEYIQSGENGFQYDPGNEQDFLEKSSQLICDRTLREKMGWIALETSQQYTWEQTAANLVSTWQEYQGKDIK